MKQIIRKTILVAVILTIGIETASAQFAGDLFFPQPSVAVESGGTTNVEIQLFSGQSVFGATQFEFQYDPAELEVTEVTPGSSDAIQNSFAYEKRAGEVRLLVLNSKSSTEPSGTVSLANLLIRPKAPAGSVVEANLQVTESLQQDETPYTQSNGLGLELVVTQPSQAASSLRSLDVSSQSVEQNSEASTDPSLVKRAERLRPAGSTVTLMVRNSLGRAVPVVVELATNDGPAED